MKTFNRKHCIHFSYLKAKSHLESFLILKPHEDKKENKMDDTYTKNSSYFKSESQ